MKLLTHSQHHLSANAIPLILRITVAGVLWPHGAQLLFGLFGGHGYTSSMQFFGTIGLPPLLGFLNIFLLAAGTLFILCGLLTRFFAAAFIVLLLGMIFKAHVQFGFFMNWFGNQKGEGFEYHLLIIGIAVSLLISGPGKWSLDHLIHRLLKHRVSNNNKFRVASALSNNFSALRQDRLSQVLKRF